MNNSLLRRGISFALTLALTLPLGLTARAAENDGLCEHHPSHTTDCGYAATGECTHQCTEESGCITIQCAHDHAATCFDAEGNSLCRHACTENPACYTPVTNCLHTEHGSCGHSEGQDCSFDCILCKAVELKGTDVVLTDGTEYTYTGNEIQPHVTVMVDRTVLVEKEHYTLSYANNIGVGTGNVTVTGIPEAGYTGTVTLPFSIVRPDDLPEFTLVEIKGTDVIIDGTEFAYTGQAIEPAVTVTVNGTVLTAGKDYSVTYANNVEPGTATVTVTGIATASETVGYTGEVSIDFTILKAQEPEVPSEPEKPTEPETPSEPEKPTEPETPSEPEKPTEPETPSEPEKPTEPETPSEPETDGDEDKEETKPFDYQITKGSGSKWRQDSGKDLSFTVNADTDDITAIRIDGKKLNAKHYTLGKNGIITLKNSWLEDQAIGTYRITVEFEDGDAEGKFTVAKALDATNPQTGDAIGAWISAMVLSLLGAAALIFIRIKRAK